MKIQYWGTSAAEGIPAIFCQCGTCKKARELGGKNLMSRSQAMIDGKILIDFNADTYMHSVKYGVDLTNIKTCLITHDHGDHLYPLEIANKRPGMGWYKEIVPLTFYCTRPAYEKLNALMTRCGMDERSGVFLNIITPFVPFEAEGYKITPLKADHSAMCEPVIYMIEKDGQTLLYGHDSGYLPKETWEYLKEHKVKFDYVSLDCTFSLLKLEHAWGHMNLEYNVIVKNDMTEHGLADDKTIFTANHFTHNGAAIYDDIKVQADKVGFLTSYDGMTVEF